MISMDIFLLGLLVISILVGLTTEGIKKMMGDYKISFLPNILTAIVSIVLAPVVALSYLYMSGMDIFQNIIVIITLTFLSWLCAMVGYDKVIQAFSQLKK